MHNIVTCDLYWSNKYFFLSACFWCSYLKYSNPLDAWKFGECCGTLPERTYWELCPRDKGSCPETTWTVWYSSKFIRNWFTVWAVAQLPMPVLQQKLSTANPVCSTLILKNVHYVMAYKCQRLFWKMVCSTGHLLCAGPADKWLHCPAFKGGGEGGGRHEKDPFCILTKVQKQWWSNTCCRWYKKHF